VLRPVFRGLRPKSSARRIGSSKDLLAVLRPVFRGLRLTHLWGEYDRP